MVRIIGARTTINPLFYPNWEGCFAKNATEVKNCVFIVGPGVNHIGNDLGFFNGENVDNPILITGTDFHITTNYNESNGEMKVFNRVTLEKCEVNITRTYTGQQKSIFKSVDLIDKCEINLSAPNTASPDMSEIDFIKSNDIDAIQIHNKTYFTLDHTYLALDKVDLDDVSITMNSPKGLVLKESDSKITDCELVIDVISPTSEHYVISDQNSSNLTINGLNATVNGYVEGNVYGIANSANVTIQKMIMKLQSHHDDAPSYHALNDISKYSPNNAWTFTELSNVNWGAPVKQDGGNIVPLVRRSISGNSEIWVGSFPVPLKSEFVGTPLEGNKTLAVQFTEQTEGKPTTFSWAFGDGGTSTQPNPSNLYQNAGKYTVGLTVTRGTENASEVKTEYITVFDPDKRAIVDFTADELLGCTPLDVQFTNLTTAPTEWPVTSW
jgi:PKD repeat protein